MTGVQTCALPIRSEERRVGKECFFPSRRRHTRFDCDWSSDVCSSDLRREVLDTVGLKDEKFIHGWDEYDWCKRIAQKGWRLCYLPDAIVVHHCGASRKQVTSNISLDKYHWDGLFYLYKKHFGYSTYVLLRFLRYLSTILKKTKIIDGLNILMEKKKWRGL